MTSLLAFTAVVDAGFLVILPKALMIISLVLIVACPISALLFPKSKGDPIFRHHVM